jgi:hypothetical protein
MAVADDVLISMKDIKKTFYTDEVETHALSGVSLPVRRAPANRRCWRFWAFSTRPAKANIS